MLFGDAETAARFFTDIDARAQGGSIEGAARTALEELRAAKRTVPGYGHPLHKALDPRVVRLLEVSATAGVSGRHVAIAQAI